MRKIIKAIDNKIVQIAAASEITLPSINKPVINIPAISSIEITSNIFVFIFHTFSDLFFFSFVITLYTINVTKQGQNYTFLQTVSQANMTKITFCS